MAWLFSSKLRGLNYRRELLPNQSWVIWRPTGMFDETEADWLHPFPLHCKKKKKKENNWLPSCGRANKIKESSRGLSLANKIGKKLKYNMDLQQKHGGKKNMHFDVDLHSGSRAREDSRWRPFPAQLAFLCHTCETPAHKPPSAWNSEAWHHHPEAAIAE